MHDGGDWATSFLLQRVVLLLFIILLPALNAKAQQPTEGFGIPPVLQNPAQCLTQEERLEIFELLESRSPQRAAKAARQSGTIYFQWPVRQSVNYSEREAIAVSNFVDHSSSFPNILKDYHCGQRTYDTDGGYNHQGTDIYSWPFSWKKMKTNQVEIIAAASGTIIFKRSDQSDQSCSFNGSQWNAVYVEHDDGSVAWYGHLKRNSLTSKEVGEHVQVGEYLGVMGSSGNSTGPHLHFEVYDSGGNLIDPYLGSCNETTDRSWWASQQDYRIPGINNLYTHYSAPEIGCSNEEFTNIDVNFVNGATVYFATYFRDQLIGSISNHSIYKPDGTLFESWQTNANQYYSGSYWWRSFELPATGDQGKWTFSVEYQGETYSEYFFVDTNGTHGEISLDVDTLFLPETPVGSTSEQSFTINSVGINGIYIESVSVSKPFISNWDGRVYDGESKSLNVRFEPTYQDVFVRTLTLNSSSTGKKALVIYGKTPGELKRILKTDGALNFGPVTVGTRSTINTSISNDGNSPLNISSITYPEGFIGFRRLVVNPGDSAVLSIHFDPTEARDYSGSIQIESNATEGPSTIDLVATGVVVLGANENIPGIIYPNPNGTGLLKFSNAFDWVRVFDSSGRLVLQNESANELNISGLNPGIYSIIVSKDLSMESHKLLVE